MSDLRRLSDWQTRLSEYLVACAHQRFEYGVLDCGLFVADAIAVMTGTDVARPLRGNYHSRAEAFHLMRALCGRAALDTLASNIASAYHLREIEPPFAGRGDAVVIGRGRGSRLGLVSLQGELLTPYEAGILRLPIVHATRAWEIG